MNVSLLCLDSMNKSSLISESVVETRIHIHLARKKPNNTIYARSLGSYVQQQFTSTIKELVRAHFTLVHIFHVMPRWAIRGWVIYYPGLHHYRYGWIASDSATMNATKFTGPHKCRMRKYIINACSLWHNRRGP
jgi:hypothetical protein